MPQPGSLLTVSAPVGMSRETAALSVAARVAPAVTAPAGVIPAQRTPAELPTPDAPRSEVDTLWATFKETGCRRSREQLILHYAPLVQSVAGRLGMRLPSSVEQSDLVSYGMFGLIDAIEKYETDRAVKFESYAAARIRGAIIDELRSLDWVPRSVRSKARTLDRAVADLEARLHRTPTLPEIAAELELPVAEVRATYSQLATTNVAALDELLGGEDGSSAASLGDALRDARAEDPAGSVEQQEQAFLLSRAVEQLSERERLVVVLYYFEGRTLAEIGRVLGVTESRISQMHTAAIGRLRTRLTDAEAA
ncbi:FliA/WhiG family RNA polymerase sigma factor [Cellulomonas marina]|uniref:RNA polymerase sigma factor n=1 Tax=Cellulomonas marina TaxID=988821 RepID=A0A1I0VFQ5_9CELL|nr:FliA/WhiG family RNA polymerase sigma factor [Cellulomonas marina]GIG28006.1 RNA polymerase sigma factor WhiG [Cellulomonas marina]SFA74863.1 RNA polymerase sigma factor for flagellar operon FliA [Cellulomonas marina]